MNILLTGGAGYIGSHTAVELSLAGHKIIIFDNFCNSDRLVVERIRQIIKTDFAVIEGDMLDAVLLRSVLTNYSIDAVIHFAGLKAVGESTLEPLKYYINNVSGAAQLLASMNICNVKKLVFSSSATVYGEPQYLPYDEHHPTLPINPYGRTKLQVEEMLKDLSISNAEWSIVVLRYFNPVGAHESGLIGEDPCGVPNNLMPYVTKVASRELSHINIFGNDYQTKDGTGERDYIHVMDLASGHLAALNHIKTNTGYYLINLGSGIFTTVLDLVKTFEKNTHIKIPYIFTLRRKGDLASYYADPTLAKKILNWEAKRSLDDMCLTAWNWYKNAKSKLI